MKNTDDLRIKNIRQLLPPVALLEKFPLTSVASETTQNTRDSIHQMLHGDDKRLLVVIGPCSIHDTNLALEYAKRLLPLREKYQSSLEIVMRVYFEKPRTTVGWKGLLNDPFLDGSFAINDGLRMARKLLLDLNEMGMPVAVEYLDMITPQYIADMVAWGAIGARTTESQVHRQLASGLSCPVGFKNATNGDIQIAVDAIGSARAGHSFLSVTKFGHSAIVETTGNEDAHIILRGGNKAPNYSAQDVADCEEKLRKAGLPEKIMIDFSHANSLKQHERQLLVGEDVANQIEQGNQSIFGVMVESHLVAGSQKLVNGKAEVYGQSITDACIGWEETESLLSRLAQAAQKRVV
ncbi:3-deoxy-7-phosphoheptulonate synthase AroG [Suttonella ornithocola]|uniref:Phospho-2-dehydro-3-deoxyheptonate aldolase n=1 Tax=Suttonella ornithocola TaxID=279832 RepID=A0A380MTJ2_9GAMM|nr:3-deoxy-7-phosphoheptulonate synthase AroG [Suttonella ornithocola]SUO95910.1 Phospho-2-dehydro-3-deoxyheptonate aldolase, Phe-sensitive [Suttonella ornithocola]